jgi:hypothetical protein
VKLLAINCTLVVLLFALAGCSQKPEPAAQGPAATPPAPGPSTPPPGGNPNPPLPIDPGSKSAEASKEAQNAVSAVETKFKGKVHRNPRSGAVTAVFLHGFLDGATVTDAGLKELAPLQDLTDLNVGRNAITDAGIKELVPFKKLSNLVLDQTQVTDKGMKDLARLTSLTSLSLSSTKVTDEGIKDLAPLKNLSWFNPPQQVTDAAMKDIAGHSELETLLLGGSKVTDAGLKDLASLKKLKLLNVANTQVSDKGVTELKKSLPDCDIMR